MLPNPPILPHLEKNISAYIYLGRLQIELDRSDQSSAPALMISLETFNKNIICKKSGKGSKEI